VLGGLTPVACSGSCSAHQICAGAAPSNIYGGNEAVTVPVWINGDVCINVSSTGPVFGNPSSGPAISVDVNGSVVVQSGNDNAIGTQTSPVASVMIDGACFPSGNSTQSVPCDCNVHPTCVAYLHGANANPNPGTAIYGSTVSLTLPPDQPFKPTIDFAN